MRLRNAVVGIVAVLLAGTTLSACGGGPSADPDKITVQLDYQLRGDHAIFYVAQKKGFFSEQGLTVSSIQTGTGSPNTLRTVGAGKADFGFADLPSLAVARSQKVPVKALVATNQRSPLAMCSKSASLKLAKVADLKGRTVGLDPAGSTYYFYQALLALNSVPRSTIKEATVTPPYENYLLTGKVDAIVCYVDAEVPILQREAGGTSAISILQGADAGFQAYGSGLFTSDAMLKKHADLVTKFTAAYMKGFQYTVAHPDEAAQILAAASPDAAKNVALFKAQLAADVAKTFNDESDQTKLGQMTSTEWSSTLDTLVRQKVITADPPAVADLFDSTAVDKVYAP